MQTHGHPSNPLPIWITDEARALVEQVIADPPELVVRRHRLSSTFGGYPDGTTEHYAGKAAARLRRIHDEWLEREFKALDAIYAVTGAWDQAASNALHRVEDAHQLIARLLKEAAAQPTRRAA